MLSLCWQRRSVRRVAPRLDLLARAQERPRGKDHRFVAAEAAVDGHAGVVDGADFDVAPLDLVPGVDDVDVIALVVAEHRALREQRGGRRAGGDPDFGESARSDRGAVRDCDPDTAEPRLRIDHRRDLPYLSAN